MDEYKSDKQYLSWNLIDGYVASLHYKLLNFVDEDEGFVRVGECTEFDRIVGVERGGCIPGVMMSHRMGLPFTALKWSTRDHVDKDNIIKMLSWNKKSILIVDDINDSGDTLNGILTRLEHVGSEVKVKTATLLSKSTSINKVDYYARELTTPDELDSWYVFPWEQLN